MSLEKNKAIILKAIEELNKQNFAIFAIIYELIAPDYVDRTNPIRGPEGLKQFYTVFFKGARIIAEMNSYVSYLEDLNRSDKPKLATHTEHARAKSIRDRLATLIDSR